MDDVVNYVQKLRPHEFKIWQGKKPLLGQIDIELTERCNNNCVHCCINLPEHDADAFRREMSRDFVKNILTEAASLGCLTVRFTGGEPLLRPDLAELYLFARRLGMQVILFTNARLFTEELALLLAKYPPGRVVEVSVYGMSSDSYDRVACCDGAFAEFRRGVDLLLQHKIPFIVKGPKLHFLKDEQEAFEAWAATIPAMERLPGYSMNFDLRSRRDDMLKSARIAKLRATPEESVAMLSRTPLYLKDMGQFCGKFMGPPGERLFNCGAGHGSCIDAYGNAQLCLPLRNKSTVADLHEVTLKRALEETFPAMREIRATNPDYLRRCARCFLKGLCEQCPAKSWMEYGTLDRPVEYLCEVAHAQARFLGLLGDEESAWEVEGWKERVAGFVEKNWPEGKLGAHKSEGETMQPLNL
ncbi:MAG: radical SAM protein [Chlorobiaceae bacterium]|nr:radical SAM protein [Chlorobiaceae bacterium]